MEKSLIDMHTHILPKIDDGSKSSEMSVKMITKLWEDGVQKIVLTPHFYASQNSVEHFLEYRKNSLERLKQAVNGISPGPEIYVGAEVFFMDSLDRVDGFERMAIEGTNYMLLEMPFEAWSSRTVETVYRIINSGITPIIAHFERFIPYQKNMEAIHELRRMGCIMQMNAEYLEGFLKRRRGLRFFDEGLADLLGSDCHNLENRPPKIREAYETVEKHLGRLAVEDILHCGNSILKDATRVL